MRTDTYTRIVLTVIAICLIWLSLGGPSLVPGVQAQSKHAADSADRMVIAGWIDGSGRVVRFPDGNSARSLPVSTSGERSGEK